MIIVLQLYRIIAALRRIIGINVFFTKMRYAHFLIENEKGYTIIVQPFSPIQSENNYCISHISPFIVSPLGN